MLKTMLAVLALLAPLVACGETKVHKSQVNATGTPDASTFLRGDGTWAAPEVVSLSGATTTVELTAPANSCTVSVAFAVPGAGTSAVCVADFDDSLQDGLIARCMASTPDLVKVQFCNVTTSPILIPAGTPVRVRVWN